MSGKSLLSDEQWRRIHERALAGESLRDLEREVGYTKGAFTKVLKRRFGWTPRPQKPPLAWEVTDAINERLKKGESLGSIAREIGATRENLYRMMERRYGYRPTEIRYRAVWAPTHRMTAASETDLAYMAGIIDGEGSIMKICRQKNPVWAVKVNMTDRPVIEWLHSFGGTFSPRPAVKNGGKKDQWEWKMHRQLDVQALLLAVLPYLRVKRDKAIVALSEFAAMGAPMLCDWRPEETTENNRRRFTQIDYVAEQAPG